MMNRQGKHPLSHGRLAVALIALGAIVAAPALRADSLYNPGTSRSMFADRRARAVGDVVTVEITENTIASQDADSELQRKLSARAEGGSGLFGILKLVPRAALGGSVEHKGSGATSRSSRLVSTIRCRVIEITPGGQLVVSG